MTTRPNGGCDDVLAAVMAGLDGEQPALPAETIDAHLAGCARCREAVVPMKALHGRLAEMSYTGPRLDLWPAVDQRIGPDAGRAHEWMGLALIAVICLAWRAGQLLFEWPLPVLNGLVPLAAVLLIAAWFVGDPFAIRMTTPDLRQERA